MYSCNRSTVEMLKYKLIFIQYCHYVVPYTSNLSILGFEHDFLDCESNSLAKTNMS